MPWSKTKVVWLLAKPRILGKLLIDFALCLKYLKGGIPSKHILLLCGLSGRIVGNFDAKKNEIFHFVYSVHHIF